MKKKYLLLLLFISYYSYAQVGINIPDTDVNIKATLQVFGRPENKNIADGLIPPCLTGLQLATKDDVYNEESDGAIVYITKGIDENNRTEKTQNIQYKGYYFYDATIKSWIPFTIEKKENIKLFALVEIKDQPINGTPNNPSPIILDNVKSLYDDIDEIKISDPNNQNNFTDIILPPNKMFKLTGYIGISDKNYVPTYIKTKFAWIDPKNLDISINEENYSKLKLNTWGFTESSTEKYNDGGTIPPICFIETGEESSIIRLMAHRPPDGRSTFLSGSGSNDTSVNSYLIIEEI